MINYIISPCSITSEGLAAIMEKMHKRPVSLQVKENDTYQIPTDMEISGVIVFLPDAPYWLLLVIRQIAFLLDQAKKPMSMLILNQSPEMWLWDTLLHLVSHRRQLSGIYAAKSNLPCEQLSALIKNYHQKCPLLEQLANEEKKISGKASKGLTRAELRAMLNWFGGYSIKEQATRYGLSHKTIYLQKTAGLKNMVQNHPHIATSIPGFQKQKISTNGLSEFEREFVHAIDSGDILHFFQPVVDRHMRLKGAEILSRWHKQGKIISPGDFLPQIHSDYAWLLLTASVLQEAIRQINNYKGKYSFAINIPPSLASNQSLLKMMEVAKRQLLKPEWSDRLALEFAETIDLNNSGQAADNVSLLQQSGFLVILDDCFSKSSILFPVRQIQFSAYKLDMSIVNDMQHDLHAMALIKSLVYYSELTNSKCIAEGVDSKEKFDMLVGIGVDRFQGYYISPAVPESGLIELVVKYH